MFKTKIAAIDSDSIIRFQDYNNKSYNLLLKLLDLYLQSLCE